ncbi:hypothetical protein [Demequina salsinemoris]|uniref:hypothetical protein n=1 Tax=Demequina salsinemoris TaxID=577470 RepID=UPI00078332A5|nr:hypothetical protein [Demequina salsinemoris]
MRPIRGPRFWGGLTAVLSVAIVAALLALTLPYLNEGADDAGVKDDAAVTSASATASDDASASASSPASSDPSATEDVGMDTDQLDYQALEAVGEGWALATAVDDADAVTLMAIDPAGGIYQAASLPEGSELLGWLATAQAVVYDPATTELYEVIIVDGTKTSFGTGWEDPEIAIPADGSVEQVFVLSGPEGERTIRAVDTLTGDVDDVADAADRRSPVSSADGATVLTAVGESPVDVVASAAGAADSSLGAPLGGTDCEPSAWEDGRQAIVVCADSDTTVWALEATTGTYAQAATLASSGHLALAASGTRVLVAGSVYGVDGTLKWELPAEAADATAGAFSGTTLVLWSPDKDGLTGSVSLVRSTGELSGVASVPDGYQGFAQVVPAAAYFE